MKSRTFVQSAVNLNAETLFGASRETDYKNTKFVVNLLSKIQA